MTVDDGKKYDDYAKIDAKGKLSWSFGMPQSSKMRLKFLTPTEKKTVGIPYRKDFEC